MHGKQKLAAVLTAFVMLICCPGCSDMPQSAESSAAEVENSSEGYVDRLTPGSDFYGYINGKELMNTD